MKIVNRSKVFLISLMCLGSVSLSGCVAALVGAGAGATGAIIGSDSRTIDTMAYDQQIETNAGNILKSNPKLTNSMETSVSIVSMSGNVLMIGQSIHKNYIKWVEEKIKKLDYVVRVYNYVSYKKPLTASEVASDSYITSEIKAKLLIAKDVKSGRFKVVTEDNVVYLMGYVTRDEAKRAVNEVLKVDGVHKIYTIFDYIENQPSLKKNGASEEIIVVPQKAATTGSNQNVYTNSTYVEQASVADNGGALIVDDSQSEVALDGGL